MYGVIDIGSNTIRLVVYRVDRGKPEAVLNQKYASGLAGYITKSGKMNKDGIQLAVDVLNELLEVTRRIQLKCVYPFATAAIRNAQNREEILSTIQNECGIRIEVLSGEEEALFDYYGAIRSTKLDSGVLVDIGGGSTELVHYAERKAKEMLSLPLGSLNLYSKNVSGIIPTPDELNSIQKEVSKQVAGAVDQWKTKTDTICAVGGSARAIGKLACSRKGHQADTAYQAEYLTELIKIAEKSPQKLSEKILRLAPDRIHTLIPGLIVLSTVAKQFHAKSIVTSPYGVREGYLYATMGYQLQEP